MAGGAQGRTRFGQVVDLPTLSDKTFVLYAQPPAFGRELEVALVDGEQVIAKAKVGFKIHDGTQLIVGVVAERPGDIVGAIDLLPNQNQLAPVIVPLDPEDLPERVEAWGGLDRLVWQDLDSNRLTTGQLASLARLGRRRRAARHRRRDRRAEQPVGIPRRPSALPAHGHRRRPGRLPDQPRRQRPGGNGRPAGARRRADRRPVARDQRRSRRRRRARRTATAAVTRHRLRSHDQVDRRRQRRRDAVAPTAPVAHVRRSRARRRQPARQRGLATARRWRCRRSAD